jgi:hypothetical protein
MRSQIDYERLIMTAVLIVALVLWGGIIAESTALHPRAKFFAAAILGVLIPVFTVAVLVYRFVEGRNSDT